jgi:hypothetical protein
VKSALTFFAGAGIYFLASVFVDWIDRRGETLAAQACVKQEDGGKWTPTTCARKVK